jgi:peptidyl-prolyl cis-trans isomerase C
MKRIIATACSLAVATLVASCTQQVDGSKAAAGKSADNVAVVDGRAISRNTYNEYVRSVTGKAVEAVSEPERKELLDNLIRGEVIAADAEASGVAAEDEASAALALSRLNVLHKASSAHYLKDRKASEEELRAEYDLQIGTMGKTQYRASHILVPSEDAAKQIIAQLKAGANFEQIARRVSTDKASAEKGGDLDWFSPESMTPVFATAVLALKKGETSAAPVQTEYGFHVLRVTDTREAVPPPYEGVKDRLNQIVEGKKFKAYSDGLLAKAKITKTL